MTGDWTRRDALAAAGTAGLAATTGCASMFVRRKRKTVTGTIDPGDAAELAAGNRLGDLTVEAESRTDVGYRALMKSSFEEKNFDELAVESRQDGDTLAVEAVHHEDATRTKRDPQLDLTLRVPSSLAVTRVRGSYGDVTVRGTTGDVTARVGSGELAVRNVDGDVTARAGSGEVTVDGVTGFAGGRVDAGDGTFVDLGGLRDVGVGSGDVSAEAPALRGDTRIEVGSGGLTLRLGDLDATVVVTVGSGDVSAEGLPILVDEDDGRARGTLGDGSHRLRVSVGTGEVELRPLDG